MRHQQKHQCVILTRFPKSVEKLYEIEKCDKPVFAILRISPAFVPSSWHSGFCYAVTYFFLQQLNFWFYVSTSFDYSDILWSQQLQSLTFLWCGHLFISGTRTRQKMLGEKFPVAVCLLRSTLLHKEEFYYQFTN